MNVLLACVAAGGVLGLLTPGTAMSRPGARDAVAEVSDAGRGRRMLLFVPPVLLAGMTWWLGAGLLAAAVVAGLGRAVAMGRARRAGAAVAVRREGLALEACGVLVDEVRAGRHPTEALATASAVDPALRDAHAAALAGTDVPAALRACRTHTYAPVAAAWQVAERHGAGLAPALARVVVQVRADRATARVVASELASARATSRLLVALPGFALVAATFSGGRPWEFLLGPGIGQICLLGGLALGWAGLRWIDAIGDTVAGTPRGRR